MTKEKILFPPEREPMKDLQSASARAIRENKNILVELGADWCVWCHRLERFICEHHDLLHLRTNHFVHMRVFTGAEGVFNMDITSKFPPFDGIPNYFIYDPYSELLHSQDTELLELGESYDYGKVLEFFTFWGSNGSVL